MRRQPCGALIGWMSAAGYGGKEANGYLGRERSSMGRGRTPGGHLVMVCEVGIRSAGSSPVVARSRGGRERRACAPRHPGVDSGPRIAEQRRSGWLLEGNGSMGSLNRRSQCAAGVSSGSKLVTQMRATWRGRAFGTAEGRAWSPGRVGVSEQRAPAGVTKSAGLTAESDEHRIRRVPGRMSET